MADIYTITNQKQALQINPSGNGFQNIWEITYKVTGGPARGTTATVEVPEEDHNAQYVDAAIRDKIAALSEVADL